MPDQITIQMCGDISAIQLCFYCGCKNTPLNSGYCSKHEKEIDLDKYTLDEVNVIYHHKDFHSFRKELRPYFIKRMKQHGGADI